MKNKVILTLIFFLFQITQSIAHIPNGFTELAFNSPICFQQGFGGNSPTYRAAIDFNLNALFFNGGVNYQDFYGVNAYIGLGFGSIIQVQYGYGFTQKKDLFRVRSDMPMILFVDRDSFMRYFSIGIYYEHTKNNEKKGNTFGISTGISIVSILNEI